MVNLIYKRPVPSTNEGNLILKDFKCEVELIRTSKEGSDLYLKLIDTETNELIEENLTIPEAILDREELKEHLLTFNYFYEEQ